MKNLALTLNSAKVEAALRELLRLYDWRNELGRIERDFQHDTKQMKTWLNQYGREKKAAWAVAREVLAAPQADPDGKPGSTVSGDSTPAPAVAAPKSMDTQRTDAFLDSLPSLSLGDDANEELVVLFARQLERELAEAKKPCIMSIDLDCQNEPCRFPNCLCQPKGPRS